ncbi:MAG: outer membrane beta-barrel protein [Nevskia sp.]|nr:outer membrane beta-barrel protein [Nevskia sp.]
MSKYTKLLSVAGLACLPGMAFADAPTIGSMLEASGIAVSGYTSASYSANLNKGKTLGFRAYDANSDTFTIDQASITAAYAPESGFGATVNFLAGEDSNVINANYGDGNSIFSLPTAYVSYANSGLTIIAGRFGSLAGYEVTADNLAPFISRSWLFQNTQPFFHTGLRASYKFNDFFTAQLGAVNSAPQASTIDANKQKTLEANLTITPVKSLLVSLTNYLGVDEFDGVVAFPINGPGTGAFTTRTNISDVVVQWVAAEKLTLALNGDVADFKGLYTARGVAIYALLQATDLIGFRARVELAEVANKGAGAVTDSFKIYTGEVVLSPSKNFDLLAEVRYDTSNNDVIPNGATPKDTGGNVAIKGIFKF